MMLKHICCHLVSLVRSQNILSGKLQTSVVFNKQTVKTKFQGLCFTSKDFLFNKQWYLFILFNSFLWFLAFLYASMGIVSLYLYEVNYYYGVAKSDQWKKRPSGMTLQCYVSSDVARLQLHPYKCCTIWRADGADDRPSHVQRFCWFHFWKLQHTCTRFSNVYEIFILSRLNKL